MLEMASDSSKWKNWTLNPDLCLRFPASPLYYAALPSPFLHCPHPFCFPGGLLSIHKGPVEMSPLLRCLPCLCEATSLGSGCVLVCFFNSTARSWTEGLCHSGGSVLSGESPPFVVSQSQSLFPVGVLLPCVCPSHGLWCSPIP